MTTTDQEPRVLRNTIGPELSSNAITVLEERYLAARRHGPHCGNTGRTVPTCGGGRCRSRSSMGQFAAEEIERSREGFLRHDGRAAASCQIRPRS